MTAATLAASSAACGGNVVVDPVAQTSTTSATGGHGGATGSGTNVSTGQGGAGGGCSPPVMPPDMLVTACFQSTYCPAADSELARQQINAALGLCDLAKDACCKQQVLHQVVCGASVSSGNCCYAVLVTIRSCG
jgi:hypothetical protein